MARRTFTKLVSDLTGDDIAEGGGETIDFAYRGVAYSIDLSTQEAAGFDKAVAVYVEHAAKQGGRRRTTRAAASSGDHSAREVRTWARDRGLDVPERGRIPAEVLERFRAAN